MWPHRQRKLAKLSSLLLIVFSFVAACQTTIEQKKVPTKQIDVTSRRLKIPKSMIPVGKVVVDHAVIRVGPSRNMPIKETFLMRDEIVIVHDHYKKWTKVYGINSKLSGWVHQDMVAKPWMNNHEVTLPLSALKKVHMKKQTMQFKTFYDEDKMRVQSLAKGESMYILNTINNRVLVWSPNRKVLLWVGKHFVDL